MDVPPDQPGIPWELWRRQRIDDMCARWLEDDRRAKKDFFVNTLPVSTPRDQYGWRSIPRRNTHHSSG